MIVQEENDINVLFNLVFMTNKKQNKKSKYTFDFLDNLHHKCQQNKCSKIFIAIDSKNVGNTPKPK